MTDARVLMPMLVWGITIISAAVTVTGFLLKNRFRILELEKTQDVRHREYQETLKVDRAKWDAEATRLRLELEQAKKSNRESDDRSRERDEKLAEKIANLNGNVIRFGERLDNHIKGSGE